MPYKVGKGADGGKARGRSTGPPKPWDDGARVSSDSDDLMPNDLEISCGGATAVCFISLLYRVPGREQPGAVKHGENVNDARADQIDDAIGTLN